MNCPPITEENFQESWKYGCRKYCRVKKAYVIRNTIFPLGLFLFSVSYLIIAYGVLYNLLGGVFRPFLQKTPYIAELWQHFSAMVFDWLPDLNWQLSAAAVVIYVPAAAAALLIALFIRVFYYPAKPELNSTPSMYPQSLTFLCEKIRHYSTPWREKNATSCRVIYIFILYGSCVTSLYYFRNSPDFAPILEIGWVKISLYFLLGFVILYLLYQLLSKPLFLLFRLLSSSGPDDHFVLDAEYYCRQQMDLSCNQALSSGSDTSD